MTDALSIEAVARVSWAERLRRAEAMAAVAAATRTTKRARYPLALLIDSAGRMLLLAP